MERFDGGGIALVRANRASTGLSGLVRRRSSCDPPNIELGDQLGVVEHVDRPHAVADDRKSQYREWLGPVKCDHAGGAVNQGRPHVGRIPPGAHRSTGVLGGGVQLVRVAVAAMGSEHARPGRAAPYQRLEVALPRRPATK